jgi:hypothetical protein
VIAPIIPAPDGLTPVARCLRIAAQRGRALRLAREQAQQPQADDAPRRDDTTTQHDDQAAGGDER